MTERRLFLNELFTSIQGEGLHVGYPTVFVRTMACHLRCHWCDTAYAFHEGEPHSVSEVAEQIRATGIKRICLTGGEPLLQGDALTELVWELGPAYHIDVETSGSLPPERLNVNRDDFPGLRFVWDIKTPYSGEDEAMDWEALARLDPRRDEIKFVVGDREDFAWCLGIIHQYDLTRFPMTVSPVFGELEPRELAAWVLEAAPELPGLRMQLQIHKYIWSPTARGV